MTDNEIRIAIAEKCGWERATNAYDMDGPMFWKDGILFKSSGLPDYPNDLNAMHEAEKVFTNLYAQQYSLFLHKLVMGTMDNFDIEGNCNLECVSRVVRATARQRAEAFLRAFNLFKP